MAYDKPYTPRPNSGSLFANKVKTKPLSPDYQGDLLIDIKSLEVVDGVAKVRLAGWKKTAPSGMVYLSIAIDTWKPENAQQPAAPQQRRPAAGLADMEDDVPF